MLFSPGVKRGKGNRGSQPPFSPIFNWILFFSFLLFSFICPLIFSQK
nr:hypothetical protein OBXNPYZZ_OBXNPYZZ_CDS_0002 [Microvirus sp.]